jgi:hypothetical protein
VTENVKWRESPSVHGPTKSYNVLSPYLSVDAEIDFFPRGLRLESLGHTVCRERIDGVESYWYYVDYWEDEEFEYGWIFGAYIAPYETEKANEYNMIYQQETERIRKLKRE